MCNYGFSSLSELLDGSRQLSSAITFQTPNQFTLFHRFFNPTFRYPTHCYFSCGVGVGVTLSDIVQFPRKVMLCWYSSSTPAPSNKQLVEALLTVNRGNGVLHYNGYLLRRTFVLVLRCWRAWGSQIKNISHQYFPVIQWSLCLAGEVPALWFSRELPEPACLRSRAISTPSPGKFIKSHWAPSTPTYIHSPW